MTTVQTVKKELAMLNRVFAPVKPKDVVTVTMWRPGGEDKPYVPGDKFRVLASNKKVKP